MQISVPGRHVGVAPEQTTPQLPQLPLVSSRVQLPAQQPFFVPGPVQTLLLGASASGGQPASKPVQFSGTSHGPTASRQTVALEESRSAGQAALPPGQFSAGSQTPAEARHGVVAGLSRSAGQSAEAPVQFSAGSQT